MGLMSLHLTIWFCGSSFAYRDTSILGKHCWRLAIIVARKDMWPQTAQWKSGRNLALFVGCLGTMQSSARRLVSLAPRDYHSVTWGQDCFICKKGGHMAKDCPDKHKRNDHQSTLCLRCGEIGHDMFGCTNDYPPDDIKQIRCYVCNQNGHLCCFDVADNCPKQISCYNCAKSGHSGLGCAKQRRETSAISTPTECYKCGEEGHFARGCTKNAKFHRLKGKSSSHNQRKEKWKKDSSARSAPQHDRKTSKRKSPHFEDRMDIPRHKSKARGGWTGGDDLDDLPFKKYKSNGWGSPSTPKKPYMNRQISDGDYFTPQSSRRHNHDYTSPNSNYSPSAKKYGFSSRFAASNTHVRFGRS
ncbi:hypothetical protein PAHAL_8G213800 [Panicum hallii]|uniref:CCHC-type domain-containing protein n=1 Tax=Panicum hallii TaxID=206008 RepID=A0A2T8I9R5_9POAL|nr:hypothetical protein PAHAL_8G213800 [Panicum hallii]